MPERTLLIRADASSRIGTGHVMRMIALAQAWQDCGGQAVMATCGCPDALAARLDEEGISHQAISNAALGSTEDREATATLAKDLGCQWIVLDGYHFTADYQGRLRTAGFKVLAVDDYGHCEVWCADAVLNQNIFATERSYKSEVVDCQFLLGTKFVLLRREFVKSKEERSKQSSGPIQRLLVTLGGTDPDNVTGKILRVLEQTDRPTLQVRVIVGSANPHLEELRIKAEQSAHQVEVLTNTRDMSVQYAWADGVVSAAGSTCWELLYYRLPAAVVTIAENQRPIAMALRDGELAVHLGWHEELLNASAVSVLRHFLSEPIRSALPSTEKVVDGFGAQRVRDFLLCRSTKLACCA